MTLTRETTQTTEMHKDELDYGAIRRHLNLVEALDIGAMGGPVVPRVQLEREELGSMGGPVVPRVTITGG